MPDPLRRALALLSILTLLAGSALGAGPKKAALTEQLGSVGQRLKRAREDLEAHLATEDGRALRMLNDAQVAFFEEDFSRAAALLLDLTAREGFEHSRAYSEAHGVLGISLWRMGVHKLGAAHLRRGLEADAPLLAPYRRLLTEYLKLTAWREPIKHARRYWEIYRRLRVSSVNAPEDDAVAYQFAKALYARGRVAEAARRFAKATEDEDGRFYLESLYFLAVIQLRDDDLLAARELLDKAEAAYLFKTQKADEARPYLEDIEVEGPPREIIKLKLSEAEILPSEEDRRRRALGVAIHLAQARLAAAMEEEPRAWRYYRKIPRGAPEFSAALSEATAILFKRGEYAWCVRLLDQLIAGRGDDLSTAQLMLWKGQLLAQSGLYETAHDHYGSLEGHFKIQADRLEAESGGPNHLFSPTLLAWSAPRDANRLRELESELIEQEEGLREAEEILEELQEILADPPLPVVVDRRDFIEALGDDLRALSADLDAAEAAWARGETDSESPRRRDIEGMRRSVKRAWSRLERYQKRLGEFDGRFTQALRRVLAEEAPRLKAQARQLNQAQVEARRLARVMRARARENIEVYAAESLFGQVDLAWWRKEAASRELTEAFKARQGEQKALDHLEVGEKAR